MASRGIKLNKEVKEIEVMDQLNEAVILKHKQAWEQGHLAAVHTIRPHQTFVGLGGYKLMYPLFEKSLSSNLNIF